MRSGRREGRARDVVLLDSSVWIRIEQNRLSLHDYVSLDEELLTCPIVIHEVLRGTRNDVRFRVMQETLRLATLLDDPMPLRRFEEAARLYKECRAAGVSPSTPDCLIVASAIAHRVPLFHFDGDFRHIARVTPSLQLFTRS